MELRPREPQQSPDFPNAFYRVTVKALIVQDEKLLVTEDAVDSQSEDDHEWEIPGGGLDFGEDPREALKREIKEEMGLEVTQISDKPLYIWTQKRINRRGLDWFYILCLAYAVKVSHYNFTPSEECVSIAFWDKSQLQANKHTMSEQMQPVADLFNPADFVK